MSSGGGGSGAGASGDPGGDAAAAFGNPGSSFGNPGTVGQTGVAGVSGFGPAGPTGFGSSTAGIGGLGEGVGFGPASSVGGDTGMGFGMAVGPASSPSMGTSSFGGQVGYGAPASSAGGGGGGGGSVGRGGGIGGGAGGGVGGSSGGVGGGTGGNSGGIGGGGSAQGGLGPSAAAALAYALNRGVTHPNNVLDTYHLGLASQLGSPIGSPSSVRGTPTDIGTGLAGLMGFLGQLSAPNMGFPSAGLAASPQGYGPYGNIGQATIAGPPTGMAQASPSIGSPLGNMASLASPLGMQALGQQRGFNSNAPSAMSSNMGFNAPSATNGFTAPGSPGMAGQPGRGTSGGYNPYQTLMQAYGGNLNGALR